MTAFGCQVNVRHILPGKQEAGAHGSSGCHLVAGELVQHKLVVRLVSVQRLDQPVAVAPCVGANLVVFKTVRLGKSAASTAVYLAMLAQRRGKNALALKLLDGSEDAFAKALQDALSP